jgi:hypothetical protein
MAIFMMVILLLPSVVKLEHHHDHFVCHAKTEKHYHTYHPACPICNFEFSIFSVNSIEKSNVKVVRDFKYMASLYEFIHTRLFDYSFLLRAPPFKLHN